MFLSKSPFYHIYVTVSHNITHSRYVDPYVLPRQTPFHLPADYARVPHANLDIDDNSIRHRNLCEKEAYEFGLD